ncbi:uncharacterized protein BO97DRAFT_421072 [Aspergillus homomorphus CBS 101889]|uniref:Uncharacterized protein n=1 Tax=Aspergillus homomorphus (strain CBS 101889) TaxID=1450537 RepID=A0A395I6K3_ASPHC|nr:hypothetical protein BO97DRAFT_421072 [Aspergillus homomorphus CBS 101889]RAL15822.1 hypothetical protein BO97DRAFT_421072 [Aspergillus homomorphus CBS 101889]
MPSDVDFNPQNLIITATDLEDPSSFSDPVFYDFHGIDPSLLFDDNGRVSVQGSWIHGYCRAPATSTSPAATTEKFLKDRTSTRKMDIIISCLPKGGTHRNHKITMSRSKCIRGPFETFKGNAVLTAEGPSACVQCLGHGELFEDALGGWWAVLLARREHGASYLLGRETYLTSVEWPENQFPSFAPVRLVQGMNRSMAEKAVRDLTALVSLHSSSTLYLRSKNPARYAQIENTIVMIPTRATLGACSGSVTFVGHRQTSLLSSAQTLLLMKPPPAEETVVGLTVYKDPFRYAAIEYCGQDRSVHLKVQQVGKPVLTVSRVCVESAKALQHCHQTHEDGNAKSLDLDRYLVPVNWR